jgi:hypothetical protein
MKEPLPMRHTTCCPERAFLSWHWRTVVATDETSADAATDAGLAHIADRGNVIKTSEAAGPSVNYNPMLYYGSNPRVPSSCLCRGTGTVTRA